MKTENKSTTDLVQARQEEHRRRSYLQEKGINPDGEMVIQDLFGRTLFGSSHRQLPNDFARSCLFTARHPKIPRKAFNRAKLFHISEKIEILYTGIELRSIDDELIWMQLVEYCRSAPLGDYIEFDIRQLIKDIGWGTAGTYYKKVRESISRMKATEIYIKNSNAFGISGGLSLIGDYVGYANQDGQPTRYQISIDKNLILLFAGETFTNIPWSQYKRLSPMARRLTDYVFSHRQPNPIPVTTFLAMCGSDQIDSPSKTQNHSAKKVCAELVDKQLVKAAFVHDGRIIVER